ncbi:MAG: phosphatase PAP2 family protein [Actinomycetota bacterium]|nr:phosphatase PAP2 family protein [Actinomycetota bacterium]
MSPVGSTTHPSATTWPRTPRPPSAAAALVRFDAAVDRWFEPLRGRPVVESTARLVSGLGDHGLVWALVTAGRLWRAQRRDEQRDALRALAVAGVASSTVNAVIKSTVRRPRPEGAARATGNVIPLRAPRTSSFPSGHTLAAWCAATVLAERDHPVGAACLVATAGLVAASRVHLEAHHASDVVGGIVIGTGLGLLGRRFR